MLTQCEVVLICSRTFGITTRPEPLASLVVNDFSKNIFASMSARDFMISAALISAASWSSTTPFTGVAEGGEPQGDTLTGDAFGGAVISVYAAFSEDAVTAAKSAAGKLTGGAASVVSMLPVWNGQLVACCTDRPGAANVTPEW
jgi:hypothetical protein